MRLSTPRVLALCFFLATSLRAEAQQEIKSSAQKINTATSNAALTVPIYGAQTVMGVNVTGLTASGATLTIEGSNDARALTDSNKTWFATVAMPFTCPSPSTFSTLNSDEPFKMDVSALDAVRFRVSATGTGNATLGYVAIPAATMGTCGGSGGGGGGGGGTVGAPNIIGFSVGGTGTVVSASAPLPVSGTFSATLSGFTPTPSYATLSVSSGSSSRVAIPSGTVDVVYNTGNFPASVLYGNGSVTATANDDQVAPGGWLALTVPSGAVDIAGYGVGGATSLVISGGAGLPTGAAAIATGAAGTPATAVVSVQGVSGGTAQPMSLASLPSLASGANTIGKVDILGNAGGTLDTAAGSSASTALGIQGIAGGVAVPTSLATLPALVGGSATIGKVDLLGNAGGILDTAAGSSASTALTVQGVAGGVVIPTSLASLPALAAGSNNVGSIDVLGHAGATLDSAAGTGIGQALAIQGVAGGVAVPVTGTLSASIGAFAPTPGYASLTVGASSARVALPTGVDVIVYNIGANPAYVLLGNSSVTATASDDVIWPNSWLEFAVGASVDLAAIETAGATTLTISGGAGIAAGAVGPQATQPVSIATLPALTTGSATIGKVDLLGNTGSTMDTTPGGSAATNALQIQGVASMTPVQVSQATAANLNVTAVGTGTFATQSAITAASGSIASGSIASGALAAGSISAGAAVSGAFLTGSIADLALAQGSTSSGQKGNMILAAATTGAPTDTTADSWPLSLTTAGGLRSDMSSIAGTTTLTGTGAVGTGAQRVAVGTDTATIAGSAPGTAGTASTNVLTVQGIASMTALLANPGTIATWGLMSGTTPGTAPTNTLVVGGIYNSAAPTPSTGQTLPLQLDSSGYAEVDIKAGAGGGTASVDKSTWTVSSTSQTIGGCEFTSGGATALTTGQMGAFGCTAARGLFTDKSSVSGTALATATEAYGTAFASQTATVERADVFVTNTNANGTATTANSSPVNIASDQVPVAIKGTADNTAFTANTTPQVPIGGVYQTSATSNPLSAGDYGMAQLTHYRAMQTDWYNSSGTEMGTSGSPVQVSLANTASNSTAVLVTGTGGTFPAALNGSPSLANGNGVVPTTSAGAAIDATHGSYTNLLQGNAVNASGNPIFAQLTTGAATIGALSANQSVNTAQVSGVTTLTGAGATGTGAQRMTVSQDPTTFAGAPPGRTYNTIAASQTTQALTGGSGGATGDYLSHCVVFPTSTSPGVVTIIDNATTIDAFPGGASSLSNLVPFTIPVGALSTSGAWKVTTGAGLSVTCVGKFT